MKKRWKFLAASLVAMQMISPSMNVGALALGGDGSNFSAGGGGDGGGSGGGATFYGVAGLRWTYATGGTRIDDSMWGDVNITPDDKVYGGITYRANGQGSYYDIPSGYTGYYMEGYQFSNPSNSLWNDYNITRAMWPESNWLFKKDAGGWEDAWGAGALPDPQAHRQAIADGYYLNSWDVYQKGDHWMDAVFYEPVKKVSPPSEMKVKRTITKTKKTKKDFDNTPKTKTQQGLKYLYENIVDQVPYGGRTTESGSDSGLPGQTYNKDLDVTVTEIRKVTDFNTQESKDGGKTWTPKTVKSVKYELVKSYTYHGKFVYKIDTESVEQPWFRPFDLNRNGVAEENDVAKDFPEYKKGAPSLSMKVDNKQKITDGKTGIQTLDTNSSTSFDISFLEKMGIPNDIMPLLDRQPDSLNPTRDGQVARMEQFDGTEGNVKGRWDLYGKYSDYAAWGGTLLAGIDTSNSSLTYNGKEQVGPAPIPIIGVDNGVVNNFKFKTIKVGDAYLTNGNNKRWWTLNYTRGNQYTYGVAYEGIVTVDGISQANLTEQNMYKGWNSRQLEQPVLKGKFTAKTVAGDLGN